MIFHINDWFDYSNFSCKTSKLKDNIQTGILLTLSLKFFDVPDLECYKLDNGKIWKPIIAKCEKRGKYLPTLHESAYDNYFIV